MPVNYRNLAQNFLEKQNPVVSEIPTIDVTTEETIDKQPPAKSKSTPKPAPAPRLRYLKFKAKDVAKTLGTHVNQLIVRILPVYGNDTGL
jgi:hypothetical protein